MPAALEVISGFTTNPGAAFTALTMSGSDSTTVRNYSPGTQALILQQWAQGATKGEIRTRSPRIHDNVQGIRLSYAAATPTYLWPDQYNELVYAQDTLTFEMTGGAAEVDCMSSLLYYQDLPGSSARLYTWQEIAPRIQHVSGVELAHTTGATAGQYGGAVAINATNDQFKANQDYAILGYLTDTSINTITIKSADFANYRVGGPGTNNKIDTRNWFANLSMQQNFATIPVFNSANKFNTIVESIATQVSTAVVLNFFCAWLQT